MKQIESEIERLTQEISNMRESAKIRAGKSSKTLEAVRLEYVTPHFNSTLHASRLDSNFSSSRRQTEQIRRMDEETQARRDAILYMIDVLAKHKEWMTKHFEDLHEFTRTDYVHTVKQFDAVVTEKLRALK